MTDQSSQSSSSEFKGKGDIWLTDPYGELPVRIGTEGVAAAPAKTVMQVFRETVNKLSERPALHAKRDGAWKTWTWKQYHDEVMSFARSVVHFGVEAFTPISFLGFNAPEWFISDIGTIAAGCIATGIYTTNGPEACFYILNHSKSQIVVVENENQLKKILAIRERLPALKAIVQYTGTVAEGLTNVYGWAQFLELGKSVSQDRVEERIAAVRPGHCSTLVYTSGTTGNPKAVMISHDSITWTSQALWSTVLPGPDDHLISYLPLSHVAAQIVDIHTTMFCGAQVWFAQPDALRGSLAGTLKEVRPTVFIGVPRVWEKIEEKMREVGRQASGVKSALASWAKDVGLQGSYAQQGKGEKPWSWWLANKLVFGKVREALGLDRCRFEATTAAPIARETLDFFLSLNLPLMEVYGMSESSGPVAMNWPGHLRTSSCGITFPGTEITLDNVDKDGSGEICIKGRHVFMGYMYDDKATAETFDQEGRLHSGDVGKKDEQGFLYITGRIKELIITAGGENVPPVLIEDEIKRSLSKVISNVMVIGDRRKFLSCVFTLRAVAVNPPVEGEYPFTGTLHPEVVEVLQGLGSTATTIQEALTDAKLQEYLQNGINQANKNATSNAQQVRKFVIIQEDFAVENDMLTPTLKLKRRNVNQKHAAVIEEMYASAGAE